MTDRQEITPEYVRAWSRRAHGSPLYNALAKFIADDPELMGVLRRIEHRPAPNLLFACVQFLLMRGAQTDLRDHYPNLVERAKAPEGAVGPFKDFVLANREWIVDTSNSRYTQTNEVKRCSALLPAVWETGLESFHLIEIGASAGLNLAMDLYRYRWGDVEWGPQGSPVLLDAESRGGHVVPRSFQPLSRTGLDLNPIGLGDEDEQDWLVALIWPEHHDRRARLTKALEVAERASIEMVAGDASETLPEAIGSLPSNEPVVVVNSMVLLSDASSRMSLPQPRAKK